MWDSHPPADRADGRDGGPVYENDRAADMYDLLYEDRKDYRAEAETVTGLIRERQPGAASLLDVACGTGLHLAAFAELFDRAEGVDIAEPMLAVARRRLPDTPLHRGDMRELRLGTVFDAVVCMFSSIAYLRSAVDLDRALTTMAEHLAPGAVLVVEPWYFPETFLDGHVSAHALTVAGSAMTRVSHSTREDGVTKMEIHYSVADQVNGMRHHSEIDLLTLFGRDDYEHAFVQAGLKVEYAETSGTPGFFVGTGS